MPVALRLFTPSRSRPSRAKSDAASRTVYSQPSRILLHVRDSGSVDATPPGASPRSRRSVQNRIQAALRALRRQETGTDSDYHATVGVFFCAGSRTRPIITRVDVPTRLLPDASRRQLTFKTAEAASRAAGTLRGRGSHALLLRIGGHDNGVFVVDFHDSVNAWDPDGPGRSSPVASLPLASSSPDSQSSPSAALPASPADASAAQTSNVRWVDDRAEPTPSRARRSPSTPQPLLRILRDAASGAPTGAKLLEMEGDTMHPTIPPGTVLRGVRLPPQTPPQPGRVYVLHAPWGHVAVKRVQVAPTPNTFRLCVDNPYYAPIDVSRTAFAQDWTVIAVLAVPDAP